MLAIVVRLLALSLLASVLSAAAPLRLTRAQYEDRIRAAWLGQMAAALMGFQFEHHVASVEFVRDLPEPYRKGFIPIDDDWYYEMVAIRAFEKYGPRMTVQQLGKQWNENSAGTWGSSEQALLLLRRGIAPPDTGHPRYNRLWFSIGPQFSADVYGLLAPGMPNAAARIARQYGHLNGYAEGVDGAVFMAGMVSLAFTETDPRVIVRKAAQLIHPSSPYRQCLDLVIGMAEKGYSAGAIASAVEERWHLEYPATNNAVANGGLVAVSVWFGEGDFLQTVNHAFRAADFTDADCNAANAAAVVGAMKGMKAIPENLVKALGDRIQGSKLGEVVLTPPVDESLTDLTSRTANVGLKIVAEYGGAASSAGTLTVQPQPTEPLPPELFNIDELVRYWNPDWQMVRAGVGGAGGGMKGIRGNTWLDGDVLATWPRDEVRGMMLTRTLKPDEKGSSLAVEVAADPGRAWALDIYAGNSKLLSRVIQNPEKERRWQMVEVAIPRPKEESVAIRLYQRTLLGPEYAAGNAYWRNLRLRD
jgi:hypothetical protein